MYGVQSSLMDPEGYDGPDGYDGFLCVPMGFYDSDNAPHSDS